MGGGGADATVGDCHGGGAMRVVLRRMFGVRAGGSSDAGGTSGPGGADAGVGGSSAAGGSAAAGGSGAAGGSWEAGSGSTARSGSANGAGGAGMGSSRRDRRAAIRSINAAARSSTSSWVVVWRSLTVILEYLVSRSRTIGQTV
jgi:hypothetical protein